MLRRGVHQRRAYAADIQAPRGHSDLRHPVGGRRDLRGEGEHGRGARGVRVEAEAVIGGAVIWPVGRPLKNWKPAPPGRARTTRTARCIRSMSPRDAVRSRRRARPSTLRGGSWVQIRAPASRFQSPVLQGVSAGVVGTRHRRKTGHCVLCTTRGGARACDQSNGRGRGRSVVIRLRSGLVGDTRCAENVNQLAGARRRDVWMRGGGLHQTPSRAGLKAPCWANFERSKVG